VFLALWIELNVRGAEAKEENSKHHEYFIINNRKSMLSSNNKAAPHRSTPSSSPLKLFNERTNEKRKSGKHAQEAKNSLVTC
jgi:hypothetical protein